MVNRGNNALIMSPESAMIKILLRSGLEVISLSSILLHAKAKMQSAIVIDSSFGR